MINPFTRSKYDLKNENIVFIESARTSGEPSESTIFSCERCNRKLCSRSAVINHIKSNIHRGIINFNTPKDIEQIWLNKL